MNFFIIEVFFIVYESFLFILNNGYKYKGGLIILFIFEIRLKEGINFLILNFLVVLFIVVIYVLIELI